MATYSDLAKHLMALCTVDADLTKLTNRVSELTEKRGAFVAEIEERRSRLSECEEAHKEGKLKQVLEEHRLRDEHERIVERRKQLSTMGGAKVGKLLEREIDIASRTVEMLEEKAMKALEEADALGDELSGLKESLESLETEFETINKEIEEELVGLEGDIGERTKEREEVVANLEDRLMALYDRVQTRYPGEAVAVAKEGACQSCFRSLPAQTYNQVLAGNSLIQCPGCSRILVYFPESTDE